jgi:hypothetical protein
VRRDLIVIKARHDSPLAGHVVITGSEVIQGERVSPAERDPLDLLIAGAASYDDRDLAADPELQPVLEALCAEVMAKGRPRLSRPRFGRNRMMLAAAFATALVLCGSTVLSRIHHGTPAATPTAGTGGSWITPGGGTVLSPGEGDRPGVWELRNGVSWINLGSPQLPAIVDGLGQAMPLPPGGSWTYVERHPPGQGWAKTDQLGETMVRQSVCQWQYYWLDRYDHRDQQGLSKAWKGLGEVTPWAFVSPDESGAVTTRTVLYGAYRPDPTLVRKDLLDHCTPEMWSPGAKR